MTERMLEKVIIANADAQLRYLELKAKCHELERLHDFVYTKTQTQQDQESPHEQKNEPSTLETQVLKNAISDAIQKARNDRKNSTINAQTKRKDNSKEFTIGNPVISLVSPDLQSVEKVLEVAKVATTSIEELKPSSSNSISGHKQPYFSFPVALKHAIEQLQDQSIKSMEHGYLVKLNSSLSKIYGCEGKSYAQMPYPEQKKRLKETYTALSGYIVNTIQTEVNTLISKTSNINENKELSRQQETQLLQEVSTVYTRMKVANKIKSLLDTEVESMTQFTPPPPRLSTAASEHLEQKLALLSKINGHPFKEFNNDTHKSISKNTIHLLFEDPDTKELLAKLHYAWTQGQLSDSKSHNYNGNYTAYEKVVQEFVLRSTSDLVLETFERTFCVSTESSGEEDDQIDPKALREMMLVLRLIDSVVKWKSKKQSIVIANHTKIE